MVTVNDQGSDDYDAGWSAYDNGEPLNTGKSMAWHFGYTDALAFDYPDSVTYPTSYVYFP